MSKCTKVMLFTDNKVRNHLNNYHVKGGNKDYFEHHLYPFVQKLEKALNQKRHTMCNQCNEYKSRREIYL